jgi:hypothetical protein
MWHAAGDYHHSTSGELAPLPVEVEQNLAVEDVERLLRGGVDVEGGHLVLFEAELYEDERTSGLSNPWSGSSTSRG